MSRFVLATLGSYGDVNPFIAVGQALRDRGHTAVIATSPEYEGAVHAAGLEHASVRPSFESMGITPGMARKLFGMRGPEYLIRGLLMPAFHDTYDDLLRASQNASMLVSHPLTFAMPLIAASRRMPWMSVVLAPMSLLSKQDPPVFLGYGWVRRLGLGPYNALLQISRTVTRGWTKPVRDLRAQLQLPPSPHSPIFEGQYSPYGTLALFDAVLTKPQADWPPHTRLCGPALYDNTPPDLPLPTGLEEFLAAGAPPIVFTLGSSGVWMAGTFWNQAIEACGRMGRRAILLTGAQPPERFPATLPADVRAYPWLPHSMIFRRAAAIVYSAGIGTLSHALRSGTPQLITPLGFDQPDNALRAARLGLARVLPFARVTARRLQRELETLLGDAGYANAAREVAARLRPIHGAEVAAEALIQCAANGARA